MKTKSIFLSLLLSVSLHAAYSLSTHETCNIPENICPIGQEHYVHSVRFEQINRYSSSGAPINTDYRQCYDSSFTVLSAGHVDEYEFVLSSYNGSWYYYDATIRSIKCRDIVTDPS